jgi:A/G-specific adenine glycosylase
MQSCRCRSVEPGRGRVNEALPFATRLLDWWRRHGRHDLPWQQQRSPYRVWLSEIMLQQTQVATVIDYFERFTHRFPDLHSLAAADIDQVLALWSGLGYYARGRNLHRAARICMAQHGGALPSDAAALEALPGIGRSTAHAILAQAFDQRAPILDGNVKRVLARHRGIAGWPGQADVTRQLWAAADALTPDDNAADYTQAIMDLGATVCRPRRPDCGQCPVAVDCIAQREDRVDELPGRKPRRERPERETTLLLAEDGDGRVLLRRRPPSGIWGGLWSLPEIEELDPAVTAKASIQQHALRHEFTHFRLHIHLACLELDLAAVQDCSDLAWLSRSEALALGLPQPIRRILSDD